MAVYAPGRKFDGVAERVSIGQSILDFSLRVRDQETGHWVTESGIAGELYIVGNLVVSGYYRHARWCCAC